MENNIDRHWHRGYVVEGLRDGLSLYVYAEHGGGQVPPWEDQVKITDGRSCGFPAPKRGFGMTSVKAAE